ncbi:hypothetical protein H7H51_23835, partial [Mycolicibacterium farcinogenes]|nr:hypothetical protein [Mycolicibacterium farcinogenes]
AQAIRDDLANTELLLTFMRLGAAATRMTIDIRAMAAEITARIRFLAWMGIGVLVYFVYGRRHSVLANREVATV